MITPPSSMETLQNFYKKIQPGGPGWRKVIDESEKNGIMITGKKEKWDVPNGILCMVFGSISVYSLLFSVGYLLYNNILMFNIFILSCIIFTYLTLIFYKKLSNH
jgi:hypothetical protein